MSHPLMIKEGSFLPCGHKNYGSIDRPATIYENCEYCRRVYCPGCNYDTHRCGYCGDDQTHEESYLDCPAYIADNPEEYSGNRS